MVYSRAVQDAVYDGDWPTVEAALDSGETDVNDRHSRHGGTYLMNSMVKAVNALPGSEEYSASTSMIRNLLSRGADPNTADDSGVTPLHLVRDSGIAAILLQHGALVDSRDDRGKTPLVSAYISAFLWRAVGGKERYPDFLRTMLRYGADHRVHVVPDPVYPGRESKELFEYVCDGIARERELIESLSDSDLVDPATIHYHEDRMNRAAKVHEEVRDLLAAVKRAGSFKRLCREPIVNLLCLRYLCLAGRATPPPELGRLFGERAPRPPGRVRPAILPEDIFKQVISYSLAPPTITRERGFTLFASDPWADVLLDQLEEALEDAGLAAPPAEPV